MNHKPSVYVNGDTKASLVYEPHGKLKRGWGHVGHQYGYVLYVRKGTSGQSASFTMSLPPSVYISYVKAIVKAVSETPIPTHGGRDYRIWLKGKMWKPPYSKTEEPIIQKEA